MTAGRAIEHKRTFHTLDGLRGIAALAVVFRHIPENAIGSLTPESYLAVDLFFILSGFVLAHAYEARLRAGMGIVDFFAARLIRLYPLYLVASLITLLIVFVPAMPGHYHPPAPTLRDIVFALFFVPQIDAAQPNLSLYPLVGPAWSLAFELAANLVFAVVAPYLGKWLLALIVAAGAALLIAAAWYFDSIDVGYMQANVWGGIGRVGFGFFAGVAAYRLWRAEALPWLRIPPWAAIGVVVAIFAVEPAQYQAMRDTVAIILMPALVLASARNEPGRWLARPFAIAGGASYGIYVLHKPIESWFETLLPWRRVLVYDGLGSWGAVALVALVFVTALLLDRFYDRPVRQRLTAMWRGVREDYHSAPRVLR
ncbi:acyltransferase family protein [Glacieibacterium megasporae]|uniref:acyltransferase family protein n=1 Tax=Glacieibacterium megasporae TaxID=2835787 RepID=UPI001C1DF6B5|nr:acyltransferase [Polymorphobacter megasporae]UAJ10155.1 acyltransferase [Polymorphobacter megasporae]